MTKPFGAFLLLLLSSAAHATMINFDYLTPGSVLVAPGTVITNQFFGVTFVPGAGRSVFVYADAAALSINPPFSPVATNPNVICSTAVFGVVGAACGDFRIDFAGPVNGFSIDTFGWDSVGTSLVVRVFQGLTQTDFTLNSPQQVNDKLTFNTALAGITSVVFTGFTDPLGNTFDNINYTPGDTRTDPGPDDTVIPEPGSLSLLALGAGVWAWARRRR
jgi:hypothetical protein